MNIKKTFGFLIKQAFKSTFHSFRSNPALFIPFGLFAIIESLALIVLFLVPRMPLRIVFGPIIKTLWSESFLHYPANFILLPKLASHSRMFLSVIIGSLLTGVAVSMVAAVYKKNPVNFRKHLTPALKKYAYLFIAILLLTMLFYGCIKLITIGLAKYFMSGHSRLLFLKAGVWLGPVLTAINFILIILLQSAFAYIIPALIIDNNKFIKAITASFKLFKRFFLPTIALVTVPIILSIPVTILLYKNALLINMFFPEITLFILFFNIVVSSLVIDPVITVATTLLYLNIKEEGGMIKV